ncbi:head completion/stabilization protein [Methylomonas sp. EFPC1]|uniref:head completion/stabilization protein n=1 Tax=Methylomonas sp. EFPC1 TaxID=2812647 RepID=UPI0019679EFC|nr:head completion/stabilization protein [Methylomonas sp. EFPC1]QSB01978.1 head completion/stabilization protein [Methylomonas sp. EFPC1]
MSLTGKPSLTTAAPFTNDGFWADLSLGDLMTKYRLPGEYADDTIKWGLTLAVVNVNLDLEAVKLAIIGLGYVTLDAYIAAHPRPLNGSDQTLVQYTHAVYSFAKAQLLPQFNSMNRREIAENAAKEAPETEQYWLDESAKAVQQLFALFLPTEIKTANHGAHVALI